MVAPTSAGAAVDLPIRPSISFSLEGEQDLSLLKLVDSVALSTLYNECFDQFAVRNPGFKPVSTIVFRVAILVDKDLGIVTTGTTSDAVADLKLDNEFIECLDASSYGVSSDKNLAAAAQIPKDGTEGVLKVSLSFSTEIKTRKEQMERTEACFALLGYNLWDLPKFSMEEALKHEEFLDCMSPVLGLGMNRLLELDNLGSPGVVRHKVEVALSITEMQPCLLEAKKRNPKLPVKWRDGELVPTDEGGGDLFIDKVFLECMARSL